MARKARLKKLTATTPYGRFTRTTAHDYRFVILHGGLWSWGPEKDVPAPMTVFGFSATEQGAKQQAAKARAWGAGIVEVYPVDQPTGF